MDEITPRPAIPALPGVEVLRRPDLLWVRSRTPMNVLCSGVAGGGLIRARHIINLHVHKDYAGDNPAADLEQAARRVGIDEPFAGLMTAAMLDGAQPCVEQLNGVGVMALATIGLGNATRAGISPPLKIHPPGTINLIVVVDANLNPAALVNLAITVTEAKCDFLRNLDWPGVDGGPITGTSTDAVALAATGRGRETAYAGPATEWGYLAARLTRTALEMHL